jgi:hypothetical protein
VAGARAQAATGKAASLTIMSPAIIFVFPYFLARREKRPCRDDGGGEIARIFASSQSARLALFSGLRLRGACYANPDEILKSPKLSTQQKRELLCKWAFDAYRVEVTAAGIPPCSPSRLDEVIDALIDLDVGSVAFVSKVRAGTSPDHLPRIR